MSRSRRKTPMFGYTTATSEAEDKRIWHKRWRAQLRGQLSRDATTDDFLPILQRAVSRPWNMDKDGKSWFSPRQQRRQAEQFLPLQGLSTSDAQRAVVRQLAKWRSK